MECVFSIVDNLGISDDWYLDWVEIAALRDEIRIIKLELDVYEFVAFCVVYKPTLYSVFDYLAWVLVNQLDTKKTTILISISDIRAH